MQGIKYKGVFFIIGVFLSFTFIGCTVKAVGDPNRPITINAHITVDVKGLKDTANNIEDYVSGDKPAVTSKTK